MRDQVLHLCRQLVRIDNRSDADLAEACGLTTPTIRRLRAGAGDTAFVRSTTVSAVASALHRELRMGAAR
jgi:hypothetical protein